LLQTAAAPKFFLHEGDAPGVADSVKPIPEGGGAEAEELSPDQLALFASQFTSFNEVVQQLRDAYNDLSDRYAQLQNELETANTRLREALREHGAAAGYLENILASMSSGVVAVDLEGKITHFNAAAERIFGLSRERVVGQPYTEVLPTDAPHAAGALRGAHANQAGEKFYTDPAGRTRPLAVSTSILTDTDGHVLGAVEIVNDLTRLRFLETEVMRVKTLAALGEMAATVAHEIRNPLGGIAGFAGLLARDFEVDDPRRTTIEKIIKGCDNLNRIVTNLLEYAQPLRLERRFCDLKAELNEEIVLFENDLRRRQKEIVVRREFCPDPVDVYSDPAQIRLALHNLLKNAADASERGVIVCRLGLDPEGSPGRAVRLTVIDDGPGVPEVHREKVFTPFFTTKDRGTGLGLATVRKVADAHRGQVELDVSDGGGACFRLAFPVG